MIKKRKVERGAFVIPSHIILRQFCRAPGRRGCEQFSSSSTNSVLRLPRDPDKRDSGLRRLFSLCLANQRDQETQVGFICPGDTLPSRAALCFIAQLIRTHETIGTAMHYTRCRNAKRHTDKIAITSSRCNLESSRALISRSRIRGIKAAISLFRYQSMRN